MKQISAAVMILMILMLLSGTGIYTAVDDFTVTSPDTIILQRQDTLCFQCLTDSIMMMIHSVKKDVAKIDSISRRVRSNTREIAENNQKIYLILNNCANQHTVPEVPTVPPTTTDTIKKNYSIEVKRKSNDE